MTYTPNTDTTATVSFYDATSKAPLASGNNVVLSGTTGQQVATNNVITIPTGYVLDADTLSNNVTLDDGVVTYTGKLSADNSDDAVIYLNHATVNYDPTQGDAIPAGLMNVTDVEKNNHKNDYLYVFKRCGSRRNAHRYRDVRESIYL
ncbi:mucin-binding protein [Secundilactobacillus collinoides]|uniref:mucin-binding protein n=1 Tax=Secundilactobacillus collinoides TaxID=33960 RepID=UPI003F707A86